jgi:hypothetical protein
MAALFALGVMSVTWIAPGDLPGLTIPGSMEMM